MKGRVGRAGWIVKSIVSRVRVGGSRRIKVSPTIQRSKFEHYLFFQLLNSPVSSSQMLTAAVELDLRRVPIRRTTYRPS